MGPGKPEAAKPEQGKAEPEKPKRSWKELFEDIAKEFVG
jgi:hypothetical protein